jgi:glycosyltransferase involved in cell wall biosynthesis
MRVLIYASAARMGGARSHVVGLIPELASLAPEDEVMLMAQPELVDELPPLQGSWAFSVERSQKKGFVQRLIWEQRVLPRIAERWRADVLLSFGSFVPLRGACPSVLEAGNALPFTRAYWRVLAREPLRRQMEERARWQLLRASLRASERVLTPTRAMRQDVVTRLPDLGPRIDVALWGVAPAFHAQRWLAPSGEIILGVSKHGINKEFDVLVAALPPLLRRFPRAQLVLTGTPEESRWSRRTCALAAELGVADHVRFAGDVPNAELPELVRCSRVVVFPTWCESFGLPLAEAMAMGAPAVAADIPACREVGGDAAHYYTTGDAQSLADAVGELLGSPALSEAIAQRAFDRGRGFTWRDNAIGVRQSLIRAAA